MWQPPRSTNGRVLYYVLRYRERRIGNCPTEVSNWKPYIDVDSDQSQYTIQGLSAYSQYDIRVWAHTDAGKGQFTTVTLTTLPTGLYEILYGRLLLIVNHCYSFHQVCIRLGLRKLIVIHVNWIY